MKIYIDGQLLDEKDAKISVFDHGLLYGDGVFEGIRFYSGRIFRLQEHLVRLYESARAIALTIPVPIEEMAEAARDIGHEYVVLTDHSPRLKVAHGLSAERLEKQLDVVAALNDEFAPFRILTGIEVDILDDGTLDQKPSLLARLDVVVASVHSKLRMQALEMTPRLVAAISNPHTDILGHCTGRLVTGRGRPESEFDAEVVFAACAQFDVAVEINSRPERLDPPKRILRLAVEAGRDADPRLVEAADLVTEMTQVKHPMDAGPKGQRGIEW